MHIEPVGDHALNLFVSPDAAPRLAEYLLRTLDHVTDAVPAFDRVTLFYNPSTLPDPQTLRKRIDRAIEQNLSNRENQKQMVRLLRVCYDRPYAPDLPAVAAACGMTEPQVIETHGSATYRVAAVGFVPGFAYLEGLPDRLHLPRRSSPLTRVPAGSVAIGGRFSGVYPCQSPGGWWIIGYSPERFFDPNSPESPVLLRVGDLVRFRPVSPSELRACG